MPGLLSQQVHSSPPPTYSHHCLPEPGEHSYSTPGTSGAPALPARIVQRGEHSCQVGAHHIILFCPAYITSLVHLSGIACSAKCGGPVISNNPLFDDSSWSCTACGHEISAHQAQVSVQTATKVLVIKQGMCIHLQLIGTGVFGKIWTGY